MALVGGVLAASSGPSSQSPCAQANCAFVLDEGWFKTIGFPFPADPEDSLVGTNHRGLIVGGHIDAEGSHGHFRERRGRFTAIDVAGGVRGPFTPIDFPAAPVTGATDINDAGTVVGFYATPDAKPSRARRPKRMPLTMSGT